MLLNEMDFKVGEKYVIESMDGNFSDNMFEYNGSRLPTEYKVGDIVTIIVDPIDSEEICFSKVVGNDCSYNFTTLHDNEISFEPYTEPEPSYVWVCPRKTMDAVQDSIESLIEYDTEYEAEFVGKSYPSAHTVDYARKYYDNWVMVRNAYVVRTRNLVADLVGEEEIDKVIMDTLSWTNDSVTRQVLHVLGVPDKEESFGIICDGFLDEKEFDEVFKELQEGGWVL